MPINVDSLVCKEQEHNKCWFAALNDCTKKSQVYLATECKSRNIMDVFLAQGKNALSHTIFLIVVCLEHEVIDISECLLFKKAHFYGL